MGWIKINLVVFTLNKCGAQTERESSDIPIVKKLHDEHIGLNLTHRKLRTHTKRIVPVHMCVSMCVSPLASLVSFHLLGECVEFHTNNFFS